MIFQRAKNIKSRQPCRIRDAVLLGSGSNCPIIRHVPRAAEEKNGYFLGTPGNSLRARKVMVSFLIIKTDVLIECNS
jgi:hypothetical protein